MTPLQTDYLVIGSGIAGLSTANVLASHGHVLIITKQALEESSTRYAQGGIAVALSPNDTPELHIEDTLLAGHGLCDPQAVHTLVSEGIDRVKDLIGWGATFDQLPNGGYSFAKEAVHQRARILHVNDATGQHIESVLIKQIQSKHTVTTLSNCTLHSLIVEENRVMGCWAFIEGHLRVIRAKSVILATGGCASLYAHHTNPIVCSGDGIAIAYEAGAWVKNMEFIQFHPTALTLPSKRDFLISEAVRGEGALLRNAAGQAFMAHYHPMAELAPRDIVARSIFFECQKSQHSHAWLDLSPIQGDISSKFPNIVHICRQNGIDPAKEWIPVSPSAHYVIGGIETDLNGCTNVHGLYAVGEVACTGVHGANRLASNSLLEGLVFGHRAGHHASQHCQEHGSLGNKALQNPLIPVPPASFGHTVRQWMWDYAGIVRTQEGLSTLLSHLEQWNYLTKGAVALDPQTRSYLHLVLLAQLVATFGINRQESRGCHYRSDYPLNTSSKTYRSHIRHGIVPSE